jgi:hypothetical protein
MANTLETPLTPAQLQILKLFARDLSEAELLEIKRLLVKYFAEKLSSKATEVWDANNWSADDTERLRNRHFRTPYAKPE